MDSQHKHPRRDDTSDEPMYSRLFIVCDKQTQEEDLRQSFSKFGVIEEIKILMHPNGAPKGACFVKFSKTSEAANALESMNSKALPNTRRPLKVLVAVNRSDVERQDEDEDKYRRLFIHLPRNITEEDLENAFSPYGRLQGVAIQRNHDTGESKGFGYVTYAKFSEAARAFEECERRFRAIFAKPRNQRRQETSYESNIDMLARSNNSATLMSMMGSSSTNFTKVNFICSPYVQHIHMRQLFDIVPGMVDCKFFVDLLGNCGKGTASYSNPASAAYAVKKLNRFEYPPGMLVHVKPDNSSFGANDNIMNGVPDALNKLRSAINSSTESGNVDLAQLGEAIAEASKLVKMATGSSFDDQNPNSNDLNYCSVKLPPSQPLANIDSYVAKRCFLVCKPAPPPLTVLRDIFCRFGDLINVYTLPNKTVGYARYASINAADAAIATLHGAEICGVRIKVLEAEDEAPPRKRRFDNDAY